ncbi:hypothetical protein P73_2214 [Celeribacter indicus]|uniref:GSCFA domain-containing protein n=1 Tax=Celeribacter indicus TaxID=1208324 RepID=A0A0B5DV85_9RHOB|nr:hypothetical protein P73_2214 [Celeribacter indicus]
MATAGSCFAQHIGRALRESGMTVLDAEPKPAGMTGEMARRYGYGLYSARYGNIYTARQMRELLEDALRGQVNRKLFYMRDGRHYDALRPGVEPEGCDTLEEAMEMRREHLAKVTALMQVSDVLVFTLGLTEGWVDRRARRVLALAPGVIAGRYRERRYGFVNFGYDAVMQDLAEIRRMLRLCNPRIRMLLTVSPVPLTATASGEHVLTASRYSKAVLRAAAGDFSAAHRNVDYFPSYELVTAAPSERAFEDNLRSVRKDMVARVMSAFLAAHGLSPAPAPAATGEAGETSAGDDGAGEETFTCEEALLEAFRK